MNIMQGYQTRSRFFSLLPDTEFASSFLHHILLDLSGHNVACPTRFLCFPTQCLGRTETSLLQHAQSKAGSLQHKILWSPLSKS